MRKKEAFSRYDAADYLKSREGMAAYLTASIEEAGDDVAFIVAALSGIARAYGIDRLSKDAGIPSERLRAELSPSENLSLAAVLKVASVLGLRLATKAGRS